MESGCTWYSEKGKTVCYKESAKNGGGGKATDVTQQKADTYAVDAKDVKVPTWEIVDKLVAPKEAGDYILQWRWDNEQTPQIWTTCADLLVISVSDSSMGQETNTISDGDLDSTGKNTTNLGGASYDRSVSITCVSLMIILFSSLVF